jgi:hypothetical protein
VRLEWIPRESNGDADDLSKCAVLSQPRIIGFRLNEPVETVPAPRITKAHTRLNRRLRIEATNDDDAWQQFKIRYGDL